MSRHPTIATGLTRLPRHTTCRKNCIIFLTEIIAFKGQSESGKSTTLKQFQLLHSPNAFASERLSWRIVIQLNLVKSIRRVLSTVLAAVPLVSTDDRWDTSASGVAYPRASVDSFSTFSSNASTDTIDFPMIKVRLLPLLRAEEILIQKLAAPDSADYQGTAIGGREGYTHASWTEKKAANSEMFVRSGMDWKGKNSASIISQEQLVNDEATKIINSCAPEMIQLWNSPKVHDILVEKRLNLTESSGLYD